MKALIDEPCILRKYVGGAEAVTFSEFAHAIIQYDEAALAIAEDMLNGVEPYHYNEDEPEFYEEFTILRRDALEAQVRLEKLR